MIELILFPVTRVGWIGKFFRANIMEDARLFRGTQNERRIAPRGTRDAIGTENLLRSQNAVVGHVYAARVMNISVRVIHAMTAE